MGEKAGTGDLGSGWWRKAEVFGGVCESRRGEGGERRGGNA